MSKYEQATKFSDVLSTFGESTPIEIRFHANRTERGYQLLASASDRGTVHYTLHYNPRSNYAMALSYISGHDTSPISLPMKNYAGWQADVLDWVLSMSNYTVDEVL